MTVHRHQIEAATEALTRVLKFERPADVVLSRFFREARSLGSHDRAFVADAVFGVLRHRRLIEYLDPGAAPRGTLLIYLTRIAGLSRRELGALLSPDETGWLDRLRARTLDGAPLGVRCELPEWLIDRLRAQMSDTEILALGRALQQPAPLDLRVNILLAEREAVARELRASGIECGPTPYSPVGLRVKGNPPINRHPLFTSGAIEVQDEGSQLLACLVAPKRHELIVDFCAGAGGKSLQLGAMMRSQGRVYAFDVSEKRLARLKPRLKRSGLSNLNPHLIRSENDPKVKRLAGKIDRVLVDAPCSGSGTLRRNPDLKWRQSPQSVAELKRKQAAILESASRLLKPGGRLVYATCSLLAEENDEIVEAFLGAHPEFRERSCAEVLRQQSIALDTGIRLRLWPHLHGTDGFFAAVLEKLPLAP